MLLNKFIQPFPHATQVRLLLLDLYLPPHPIRGSHGPSSVSPQLVLAPKTHQITPSNHKPQYCNQHPIGPQPKDKSRIAPMPAIALIPREETPAMLLILIRHEDPYPSPPVPQLIQMRLHVYLP
jgi:hypothetical protein